MYKIIPAIFFGIIFIFVVLQIPYPDSLAGATLVQIMSFFIPLYLAFVFTFNIFLKSIFLSSSIALGLIFMLILQGLDSLNFVTGILVAIAAGLLFSYFKKAKRSPSIRQPRFNRGQLADSGFKNLTKLPKIPRLTRLQRRGKNDV